MNIIQSNLFSYPISIKNSFQTSQNSRILTPEKVFTIAKKRGVSQIGSLYDKSRIDDIDLAMCIFSAHLFVGLDSKIGISRKIILDFFEIALKLLEHMIFLDKLDIRSAFEE
ncbi:hypothetical protein KKG31_03720 [Patescibacteria group bacterium]|nr:hypothetical protein [Patescibacteria group bacterium]MBU1758253.1 hypothetical protein [Patescibacteria group bacterium]